MSAQPADGSPDFAHTRRAQVNRSSKAFKLARSAAHAGLVPYELDPRSGPTHRALRGQVRKAAGVRSVSDESWAETVEQLWWLLREAADGECSSCSCPTRAVMTEGGRALLLNPLPHPEGNVHPVHVDDEVRARVLGGGQARPDGALLFRPHAGSCPDGDAHRRRRLREAVRCTACGLPLDRDLLRVEPQHLTHPTCTTVEDQR